MALISALLAFAGYTVLNLGQAGQKIGLELKTRRPYAGWVLWGGATLSTSVSFFLVYAAISIGSVVVVGAMAGTGLASLAVFSHFVMHENLKPRHAVAVVVIIVAAGGVAFLNRPHESSVSTVALYTVLAAGTVIYTVACVAVRDKRMTGVLLGGFSGFLGAYSQLFQKLSSAKLTVSEGIWPLVRSVIANPITLIWVGLSLASMLVIQFGYRKVRAIRIIPVFTANFIVVPVLGGVLIFGESLSPLQWIGVAVILAGSVILGRRHSTPQPDPQGS